MSSNSTIKWGKKELFKAITAFLFNTFIIMAFILVALFIKHGSVGGTISFIVSNFRLSLFTVFAVVVTSVGMFLYFYHQNKKLISKTRNITMLYSVVLLGLIASYSIGKINPYFRPVSLCAILVLVLTDKRTAVFMNTVYASLMLLTDIICSSFGGQGNYVLVSLIMTLTCGTVSVFLVDGEGSRAKVLAMGFLISIPAILFAICVEFTFEFRNLIAPLLFALGSGLLSVSIMTVILPVYELLFSALTNFRLTELTDHKSKLIKELSVSAPGTFSHTIIVAMLAEACGNAIGENPLLVRACAYYHDIGKLKNPDMFTENQSGKNPHDELSPELSTDIIRSHAKDGAELIRKRRLPEVFADAAEQHHGTLPIRYFYMKASKFTDGKLGIENFSYYGPKPQNKVNAIIMICDACEAKVRTVGNRTHENVDKAVKEIIEERMELDQFNECDITFKELDIIRNTITNTLSGVYHERVRYPKLKIGGRRG
ncbi:MAG: HDIG domain-containing protein [Clostridia bacterium]|nr:HDIG domain-containing protein [Clostridia bacterium]